MTSQDRGVAPHTFDTVKSQADKVRSLAETGTFEYGRVESQPNRIRPSAFPAGSGDAPPTVSAVPAGALLRTPTGLQRLPGLQQVSPEDAGDLTHPPQRVQPRSDELRTAADPGQIERAGDGSRETPRLAAGATLGAGVQLEPPVYVGCRPCFTLSDPQLPIFIELDVAAAPRGAAETPSLTDQTTPGFADGDHLRLLEAPGAATGSLENRHRRGLGGGSGEWVQHPIVS